MPRAIKSEIVADHSLELEALYQILRDFLRVHGAIAREKWGDLSDPAYRQLADTISYYGRRVVLGKDTPVAKIFKERLEFLERTASFGRDPLVHDQHELRISEFHSVFNSLLGSLTLLIEEDPGHTKIIGRPSPRYLNHLYETILDGIGELKNKYLNSAWESVEWTEEVSDVLGGTSKKNFLGRPIPMKILICMAEFGSKQNSPEFFAVHKASKRLYQDFYNLDDSGGQVVGGGISLAYLQDFKPLLREALYSLVLKFLPLPEQETYPRKDRVLSDLNYLLHQSTNDGVVVTVKQLKENYSIPPFIRIITKIEEYAGVSGEPLAEAFLNAKEGDDLGDILRGLIAAVGKIPASIKEISPEDLDTLKEVMEYLGNHLTYDLEVSNEENYYLESALRILRPIAAEGEEKQDSGVIRFAQLFDLDVDYLRNKEDYPLPYGVILPKGESMHRYRASLYRDLQNFFFKLNESNHRLAKISAKFNQPKELNTMTPAEKNQTIERLYARIKDLFTTHVDREGLIIDEEAWEQQDVGLAIQAIITDMKAIGDTSGDYSHKAIIHYAGALGATFDLGKDSDGRIGVLLAGCVGSLFMVQWVIPNARNYPAPLVPSQIYQHCQHIYDCFVEKSTGKLEIPGNSYPHEFLPWICALTSYMAQMSRYDEGFISNRLRGQIYVITNKITDTLQTFNEDLATPFYEALCEIVGLTVYLQYNLGSAKINY